MRGKLQAHSLGQYNITTMTPSHTTITTLEDTGTHKANNFFLKKMNTPSAVEY